jgi:thiamine biosynthesis lipoprotein
MLPRRQFLKFSPSTIPTNENYWLHISRAVMACRFEITLPVSETNGVNVANQALDEADRLEQQLTIFKETSEISFINKNAAANAIKVSPSLFQFLLLCQSLYRATEGAFDITSAPLSRCWGFLKRQGRIPDFQEIEIAKSCVGSDKLLLDEESRTIRFTENGVEINLGSIGKGYALDCLKSQMRPRIKTALLSAGASSFCAIGKGDSGHDGWSVGIRHPRHKDRRLALLKLRDCAMATSGDEEQFFEYEGRHYGHIIDPRTGSPAQSVASVTVVAQSAAIADALATAFYVGGRELVERYCSTHPNVLVIMLEAFAEHPFVSGSNHQCEVEIVRE